MLPSWLLVLSPSLLFLLKIPPVAFVGITGVVITTPDAERAILALYLHVYDVVLLFIRVELRILGVFGLFILFTSSSLKASALNCPGYGQG